jgi:hypothetical protein
MRGDVAVFKRDLLLRKILFHFGAEQSAGLTIHNDFSRHPIRSSRGSLLRHLGFTSVWLGRTDEDVPNSSLFDRCRSAARHPLSSSEINTGQLQFVQPSHDLRSEQLHANTMIYAHVQALQGNYQEAFEIFEAGIPKLGTTTSLMAYFFVSLTALSISSCTSLLHLNLGPLSD